MKQLNMKQFKNKTLVGLTIALCSCFTACLDDNEPLAIYPTLGTISATAPITIESDSYGSILPKNPSIVTSQHADSVGQRVLTNLYFDTEPTFENGGTQHADILDLYKILTKPADDLRKTDAPSADSFGNSPIQPTSLSLSKEHLNIQFNMLGGTEIIPHRISLLLTADTQLDENGMVPVMLRHNANGDSQNTIYWGIVSFTLASIPEYNDPACKGVRLYYNSGANLNATMTIRKETSKSDELTFRRMMETSQEVGNEHTLLTGHLQ